MPKLYSSKQIEKVLLSIGYNFITQKGSHGKFKDKEGNIVILPTNKKKYHLEHSKAF